VWCNLLASRRKQIRECHLQSCFLLSLVTKHLSLHVHHHRTPAIYIMDLVIMDLILFLFWEILTIHPPILWRRRLMGNNWTSMVAINNRRRRRKTTTDNSPIIVYNYVIYRRSSLIKSRPSREKTTDNFPIIVYTYVIYHRSFFD